MFLYLLALLAAFIIVLTCALFYLNIGMPAHSPIFEEPEKVKQIIESDILKQRTNLADKY